MGGHAVISVVLLTLFSSLGQAATISKTNNDDNLNLGSSWVGGTAPGFGDLAQWDSTVASSNTVALGGNLTWQGIKVTNPGGLVTINGGSLLVGSAATDIDMTAATQDLLLNCNLLLGGANTWDVTYHRTLTVNGQISGISGDITKQGFGTAILTGENTNFNYSIYINEGVLVVTSGNAMGDNSMGSDVGSQTYVSGTGRAALHIAGGIELGEIIYLNSGALAGTTAYGCLRSLSGTNSLPYGFSMQNSSPRIGADTGSTLIIGGLNLVFGGRTITCVGEGDICFTYGFWKATSGVVANLDRRLGAGTLQIGSEPGYDGFTRLYDGTMLLDYDNYGRNGPNASRLPDAATLGLNGGTLTLSGGSHAEMVGDTTIGVNAPGGATLITRIGGDSTLHLGAITRAIGGTLDVGAPGIAYANGGLSLNGIVPWATFAAADWATKATTPDTPITNYFGYQTATDPTSWAATDNVTLATSPGASTATRTINSLRLTGAATVQIDPAATLTLSSGGLLVTGSDATTIIPASGTAALRGAANGDLIVHQYGSGDLTLSAIISNNVGATALTKSGSGKLVLTGTNAYTGSTFINEGTLSISANANLGDPATGAQIYFNGGTLEATTTFILDNAGANKRNIQLGETVRSTIQVATNNALTVSGVMMGRGWLTKTGGGTLILTGTNTYAGETIVRAGTLLVNGAIGFSNPAWSNTVVTVESGATLGGTGAVGSNTSIKDGATLAPGASPGTLRINGDLTLSGMTLLSFELRGNNVNIGNGINDLANVYGALTLDGILNVSETVPGSFLSALAGYKWRLFTHTNTAHFKNNGLSLGIMPALSPGLKFVIDTATSGQVNLMVVSSVAPRPRIVSVGGAGTTNVTVTWTNAVAGTNYILQYKTNLDSPDWTGLGPVTAVGATASQTDNPVVEDPCRYYRVMVQ